MRAFVTGGAGFIGSTLVDRLLAEGHGVDVVDDLSGGSLANLADARRDPDHDLHFQRLDVTSEAISEVMGRRRPDVVFHLASGPGGRQSLADPVADATTTVLGSLRVLEAARLAGVRKVVYATSAADLYTDDPATLPSRESAPIRPLQPHGVAQDAVARYLTVYRDRHALEFTALALSSVYGPRQDPAIDTDGVAALVRHHLADEPVDLGGDGARTRDLVYVDDVVDALARAAERGSGLLLNVGTGVETSTDDLVAVVAGAVGRSVAVRHQSPPPGEPRRCCVDPGRAAIHLGWKPWTTLADGVDAVVQWARRGDG